jgi:hypothetical protein
MVQAATATEVTRVKTRQVARVADDAKATSALKIRTNANVEARASTMHVMSAR